MTLTQLEYLVAIERFGNFSEAAKNCFVTQPTLSMQIQKLEEELGVTIFRRDKQPIEPTDIGKKILEQAKQVLKEKEKLHIILQIEKGEFVGSLRVAIIPTISSYLLPMFLSNFTKKYPEVELVIDEVTTDEVISGLEKNYFDIGVIALRSSSGNFLTETLYYEPFVAFLPPEHKLIKKKKISQEDLDVSDFLLLKEGHCLREQTLAVCKSNENEWIHKSSKVIFESGNLDTLIKLVEQKFGMTLLPYLALQYIKDKNKLNLIKEFNAPVPKREVGLIYTNTFIKKHLLEALKSEILRVIPEELKRNKNGLIVH
ncbi:MULTISPECIES: hydrogen peroxide-inducible genes activator [Ignavibacterium]|jgi:LysR family hydrogen peroxide-inducible transcriptional activator|uniref:hydrogen peroxide-inducible genes activator n=1 Tax=Ignavibacterium TaxID=795750 RepID=UPI0025C5F030|nr:MULTISPECIES: hydrogen peroxide-inducible genes activator [Ignavibacterium]MBI5661757.1 hydrogen peroxide-inducible genes activator [Ignavibacterium album]